MEPRKLPAGCRPVFVLTSRARLCVLCPAVDHRACPPRFQTAAPGAVSEAGWEILENSPIIINRYRAVTIALGYVGDSIMNSLSDVVMMSLGFLIASRVKPWVSVALVIAMEIGCAYWVRDNLTLNIIMLIHPVDAIRAWQTAGHPLP
jgi:hypothetical protein